MMTNVFNPIRFRRVFVLPLIVFLACFVIVLSWWTIQLQLNISEADLNRLGTITVENLSKSSVSLLTANDFESLKNVIALVKEKEADILTVEFLDLKGKKIIGDGDDIKLPLDPDRLKFMKATEIHKNRYFNLYLSPIFDKRAAVTGVSAILLSKDKLNTMNRKSKLLFVLIVFGVVSFNVFIYQYLVRESLRAYQLERAFNDLKNLQDRILQQEKMAAIGRLASGVGHELRNPLGAIKNAVYYIRDAIPASNLLEKDPTVSEFLEMIETEIKNSTEIISDLLDFSKVGKLHPQLIDLGGLLWEAKAIVDVPDGIEIRESFSKDIAPVQADPVRLRQVFLNLIVNAIQAMPKGGTLYISTEKVSRNGRNEIQITFKDTGTGISPENMKKIFEPLFTTKDRGTGLGLAICQGIVSAHGGKIEVRSEPGNGSEFVIRLFPPELRA